MSLVLVGLFLAAVGAADLGRAAHDSIPRSRHALCLAVGGAVLVAGLVLVRPGWGWGLVLLLLLGGALAAWLLGSALALDTSRSALVRHRGRGLALLAGVGGLLVALLGVETIDHVVAWPTWLDRTLTSRWPATDLVVAGGVVLANLATANLVVRLLLDAVGVPAVSHEKQLKGGRVLGPMERLFLVGLGAMGELTAAAIVVAAKGLLRFPELQRAQQGAPSDGPSDVTEYFLIGSFASWLFALGGAALIYLA